MTERSARSRRRSAAYRVCDVNQSGNNRCANLSALEPRYRRRPRERLRRARPFGRWSADEARGSRSPASVPDSGIRFWCVDPAAPRPRRGAVRRCRHAIAMDTRCPPRRSGSRRPRAPGSTSSPRRTPRRGSSCTRRRARRSCRPPRRRGRSDRRRCSCRSGAGRSLGRRTRAPTSSRTRSCPRGT